MTEDIVEKQYETIKHHVNLCLKKGKKKEAIVGNQKSLPDIITLAYFGIVFKSIINRSIADIERSENDIEKMVDFFFKKGAS